MIENIRPLRTKILLGLLILAVCISHLLFLAQIDYVVYDEDHRLTAKTALKGYYQLKEGRIGAFFADVLSHHEDYPKYPAFIGYLTALACYLFGLNEVVMRWLPLLFYLILIYFTYKCAKEVDSEEAGLLSVFILATMPVIVFYSRMIFPAFFGVAFLMGALYTLLAFPTNGILTARIIDIVSVLAGRLKGKRLFITCSIDGPGQTHDRLKGLEGAYDRCIETFTMLRRITGVRVYLGVTVYRGNYRELPKLFSDLQERIPNFNLSELHLNFAERSIFYNMPAEPSAELVNREVYFYIKDLLKTRGLKRRGVKGFLEKRYLGQMDSYLNSGKTPMNCTALEGACFIDPYGDLFPCVNYPARIGNLERSGYNLPVFWRSVSEKRKEIRRAVKEKNCPNCWTPCEAYPSILRRVVFQ